MKFLIMMFVALLAAESSAHELNGQNWQSLNWLSQTAKLHAQKICANRAEKSRIACESEQIKSLSESAASVTAFVPANVSQRELALMIENHARFGGQLGSQRNSGYEAGGVDCRINVC